LFGRLKKFGHVLLRQPHRLIFQFHLQPRAPILGLIKDDLRSRRWIWVAHTIGSKQIQPAGQAAKYFKSAFGTGTLPN